MTNSVRIIGGGLAGSESALVLARAGYNVHLVEMRPAVSTPVHKTDMFAELVCSNSFKSEKRDTAAGMMKAELGMLSSPLLKIAYKNRVEAGGALAVDRDSFAQDVTCALFDAGVIIDRREAKSIDDECSQCDALILATGPLTSDSLAQDLCSKTNLDALAFYDAAAPIVEAASLDRSVIFSQNRYEDGNGDYLNAPLSKEEYEAFIEALLNADMVILKDFETKDLFQACQPIEEIARKGNDAPRFGPMKPVGLIDPRTGRRPWAAVQLRAENAQKTCFNLVGFQTNLTFTDQARVFRMIPGLEHAEFSRYGVMHRNTFINAPTLVDRTLRLNLNLNEPTPVFVAGQLSGTEGYVEAIRSGHHAALSVASLFKGIEVPKLPATTAFGALIEYATNPQTRDYQPSHVNFGLLPPLEKQIRNKKERYAAYALRAEQDFAAYYEELVQHGLVSN